MLALALVTLGFPAPPARDAAAVRAKLFDTWESVRVVANGRDEPVTAMEVWALDARGVESLPTFGEATATRWATAVRLDVAADPMRIDFVCEERSGLRRVMPCVFKFDGPDRLVLARPPYGEQWAAERPDHLYPKRPPAVGGPDAVIYSFVRAAELDRRRAADRK